MRGCPGPPGLCLSPIRVGIASSATLLVASFPSWATGVACSAFAGRQHVVASRILHAYDPWSSGIQFDIAIIIIHQQNLWSAPDAFGGLQLRKSVIERAT